MADIEAKIAVILKTDNQPIYNAYSDINKHNNIEQHRNIIKTILDRNMENIYKTSPLHTSIFDPYHP